MSGAYRRATKAEVEPLGLEWDPERYSVSNSDGHLVDRRGYHPVKRNGRLLVVGQTPEPEPEPEENDGVTGFCPICVDTAKRIGRIVAERDTTTCARKRMILTAVLRTLGREE